MPTIHLRVDGVVGDGALQVVGDLQRGLCTVVIVVAVARRAEARWTRHHSEAVTNDQTRPEACLNGMIYLKASSENYMLSSRSYS